MDFSSFTFSYFPESEVINIPFPSFSNKRSVRLVNLPRIICQTLRKDPEKMSFEDKEVIPFLFSKKFYSEIIRDKEFLTDVQFLIEKDECTFWFLGEERSLNRISLFLQNRFPLSTAYFHKPSENDLNCSVYFGHSPYHWQVIEYQESCEFWAR